MDQDKTLSRIDYLARALKAPRIRENARALAPRALEEAWTGPQYLEAVLSAEVAAREASGARIRIKGAGFPAIKTVTDFNFDHQPDADPGQIHRLAAGGYLAEHRNIILLGPPGTGKTHLAIALGISAATAGTRVAFDTAAGWGSRLQSAHGVGRLDAELRKIDRYGLIAIDEVGYLPFSGDAAHLFFQLVARRYETASIILTSNLAFSRWGEVFGDQVVAAAMIDRMAHHADIITLTGSSYRLRHNDIDTLPSATAENKAH